MSRSGDEIEIGLSFEEKNGKIKFEEGRVTSKTSALARPYLRLFEEGRPIGNINHIFFKGNRWPSNVLGSLAYTEGERILFFPGLSVRNISWFYSQKRDWKSMKTSGLLDHLTLEKDLKKWHITLFNLEREKTQKLPTFKTMKARKDVFFWFGLSIRNIDVLERTPQELRIRFPSPSSDSSRRINVLSDARKNAIMHLVTLSDDNNIITKKDFLHFDFFIRPNDLNVEKKTIGCYVPIKEPIVKDYIRKTPLHIRGHPVTLEGINGKIWIVASKHIGKLNENAFIACYQGGRAVL